MFTVRRTKEFDAWFLSLRDGVTRARLAARLRKAQLGNLGDVKSVESGVYEMREDFGPGWRLYYVKRGRLLIVMLGGGDKSTQAKDIAKAVKLAAQIEN
ncbi:addiction module killer protein [Betaproteobacteria bacterium UKL13-2]|nr:addiction module killer protein [Betaproteobacteria bacterium UKL13-2]HCG53090.1 addiction module killer protein [Betaproteobacteria bacterium]